MSVSLLNVNGNLQAVNIQATGQFNGSGAGLSNGTIPRGALAAVIGDAYKYILNDLNGFQVASSVLYSDVNNKLFLNPTGGNMQLNAVNYVLPSAQGNALDVLQNNGSGTLSWAALPALSVYVSSTDTTPQILYAGNIGLSRSQIVKIDLAFQDNTNDRGNSYTAYFQVKQPASGAPSVFGPFNVWSYIDALDSAVVVSIAAGAQGLYNIMVQGLAATNIL